MNQTWIAVILCLVALVVTAVVFPFVLHFAKKHNFVDNPNARKLQRVPVPVIGGTAVFIGFAVALGIAIMVFHLPFMGVALAATGLMWLLGTWDDMKDIPPNLRFLFEIAVLWGMISIGETCVDDFHGLWGVHEVSLYVAVPLSIFTGVGIMNAVNMIDGVDGYCSGFGILSSLLFSIAFFVAGDIVMASFALICVGALIPFFLHNVFGKTTKMFLGDGGSLMIGMLMTIFVFRLMSKNTPFERFAVEEGMSIAGFVLAVMCIPVADTLRVMTARILKGGSPFAPDKTHLHHLFIEMGFTHVGTSFYILFLDLVIMAIWLLSWKLGASYDLQLYVVIGMGLLVSNGFFYFMHEQKKKNDGAGTPLYQWFCKMGAKTHIERGGLWKMMTRLVDGKEKD
ncbi:MAG: undecaprenyl/decaprenyl-phosphate alpha-N-acetylglucosaminyl 1-phosphate transferase [Bacteroidales bacterium]|nr:undecaprenyl/decaprenyl-phosphate alpha-N-acetylglucosaminyl 1-phosphate transferase [Bacteroidales bacterium]